MAPKKHSSSSSSSRHDHAHTPHRGPDRHHHPHHQQHPREDDVEDDVEDSGRDTLKPLLSSRDRESRRGHGRSSRGPRPSHRETERHGRSSRRDDGGGRGHRHDTRGNTDGGNGGSAGGDHGGLGRILQKKSRHRHRDLENEPSEEGTSSEFQELLADQTSVACSTITPPSVFRDMDDGFDDDDDDITDEGGRRMVQGSGYANYRVGGGGGGGGVHQRNPPPSRDADNHNNNNNNNTNNNTNNNNKTVSSSLRRFGYAGFRKNAARRTNTVHSRDNPPHIPVHPGVWNSLNRTALAANSSSTIAGGSGTVASAIHSAKLAAASSNHTTTGVVYRSADATHRALEELKRKKAEAREKRRAVVMLCALVCLALGVHFAGRVGRSNGAVEGGEDGNLKGSSKEKKYGNTKDLGYGGERAGVAGGARGVGQYNLDAYNSNNNNGEEGEGEDDYESLPPPVEKIYDEDHQYLVPLRHFADVKDPHRPTDTAFFFHVPRSGGSTLKDMVGKCLKLVQSSEVGVRDGHGADPMLQVIEINESKYVNVDTTTIQGIQRAVDLGLATSNYADLVVSSYLHQSASLFDLHHQARAFLLLRNPIERATSMYYHRIHELGDLDPDISIEDFAQGNGIENNWMTRFLTDRMEGELTKADLEQAKEILKVKFLVGFLDDIEESIYRFMKYNRWKYDEDENQKMKEEDCIRDLAMVGSNINPNEYELPKRGTQAYALITWQTQFDTKLYEYGKELFDLQTKTYGSKERKKMMKKQKKKGGKL